MYGYSDEHPFSELIDKEKLELSKQKLLIFCKAFESNLDYIGNNGEIFISNEELFDLMEEVIGVHFLFRNQYCSSCMYIPIFPP